MTLEQVLLHEGYLGKVEIGGLHMILAKMGVAGTYRNTTKDALIGFILREAANDHQPVHKLVLEPQFLRFNQNAALDLILTVWRISNTGDKASKINSIHNRVPLEVQVQGPAGFAHALDMPRLTSMINFKQDLFDRKYLILVNGVPVNTMCCFTSTDLQDNGTITVVERLPQPVPPLLELPGSFQVFMTFHGTHTMVVVPEMTIDELTAHFVSIPACRERIYYNNLHLEHVRFYISGRTLALGQSNLGRLAIGSGPEVDGSRKLEDYNIQADATIRVHVNRPGGMAKKGVRRTISKNEKIVLLRAKANYETTGLDQNTAALATTLGNAGYTVNAIMQMQTMEQLHALEAAADVTRADRTPEAVDEILVPQLRILKQQKADLEKAISALEHSYNLGFNEAFYTDNGLNTTPMWDAIETRKGQIQNAVVEAEVQRRMQAQQQAAAAAANNGDANMNAEN